jgi:thioredoxin reductase
MNTKTTVVIVGGGTSGSACALFLGRAKVNCVVLDQGKPIIKLAMLNNFPGLDPILGTDWLAKAHGQLSHMEGVSVVSGKVTGIKRGDGGYLATLENGDEYACEHLVLASGPVVNDFLEPLGLVPVKGVQPYVKVNVATNPWGETVVPNVYACGVLSGVPSQAVICAGNGATVGVGIATKIKGEYFVDHDTPPKKA